MNFLDLYELRARLVPSFIVMLPIMITFVVLLSLFQDTSALLLQLIGSGIVILVLVYIASFIVRYYGQRIEKRLWVSWGGPPSIRFMRWSDSTFGNDTKQKLHKIVKATCSIELKSHDAELNNLAEADDKITQAFSQVKNVVRQKDPQGVWLIHNAEYGLHRNLYGSRFVWLILSLLGTGICAYFWRLGKNDTLLLGVILNAISFAVSFVFGWYYLPRFVWSAANRYAESVWTTFLVVADKDEKKQK